MSHGRKWIGQHRRLSSHESSCATETQHKQNNNLHISNAQCLLHSDAVSKLLQRQKNIKLHC